MKVLLKGTIENFTSSAIESQNCALRRVEGAKSLLVNGANNLVLRINHNACGRDLPQEILFPIILKVMNEAALGTVRRDN